MPKVSLTTLTPVHIGSGQKLAKNTEFIFFDNQDQLAVIDDRKILDIIGEENIHHWVSVIDANQDLKDLIKTRFSGSLRPSNVAKRVIDYEGDKLTNELNEQLHSALNGPYIPGSSIKGAIRTAVFATKVLDYRNDAINALTQYKLSDSKLIKKVFGDNANDNLFRFVQVGDAYFGQVNTVAYTGKILNLNRNKWRFKQGQEQLVECIPQGLTTSMSFKINTEALDKNRNIPNAGVLSEKNRLFKIVNNHTAKLLQNEIEFWQEEIDEAQTPVEIDDHLEALSDLKSLTEKANPEKEMIFRMGFGSGWNFITGAWAKDERILNENQYDRFIGNRALRYKQYDDAPFPKTRKLISSQEGLLGFVRLRIED